MVLSIFTSFYSKGSYISQKDKIFKHYIYNSFIWDILGVIPVYFISILGNDLTKFILMSRIIKMLKLFHSLEVHLFLSKKIKGFYDLFKLLILIIFMGHFFATFLIYVSNLEISYGSENTWLQNFKIIDQTLEYQYISALYFAVYTMVTVGYGDLYPINLVERVLFIVLMVLSCGVFAYALNRFGIILDEMYRDENFFKYNKNSIFYKIKLILFFIKRTST